MSESSKRSLGYWSVVAIGVGGMVGGGIFAVLGVAVQAGIAERGMAYDSNPLRFLWRLLRRTYDVAIDTEQFHHFSAVFAFLSGAPVRIGFKRHDSYRSRGGRANCR